ncbi:MAG: ATP-binding cassette domain-containing protein [Desulfuromonadaceae bacterium]
MKQTEIFTLPGRELYRQLPEIADFFASFDLILGESDQCVKALLDSLSAQQMERLGMTPEQFRSALSDYVSGVEQLNADEDTIRSIHICGGRDKSGRAEDVDIELVPGQIISIVGPTGSGKSRLLGDIEWVAQGDTPTGRTILINQDVPDPKWRFSTRHKLVAQLSQNMNFVMDLSVEEFIRIHGESRFVPDLDEKIEQVMSQANALAGEPFDATTHITALSGGQSRALMIADIAILSSSPVVLIDEIENAGIERKKALELLVRKEKIVLIATHDPILALMGEQRLVLRNGGIARVIETSNAERANLVELERLDRILLQLRQRIRSGETLESLDLP